MCVQPSEFSFEESGYENIEKLAEIKIFNSFFNQFEENVSMYILRVKDDDGRLKYTVINEDGVDVCGYNGEYYRRFSSAFEHIKWILKELIKERKKMKRMED